MSKVGRTFLKGFKRGFWTNIRKKRVSMFLRTENKKGNYFDHLIGRLSFYHGYIINNKLTSINISGFSPKSEMKICSLFCPKYWADLHRLFYRFLSQSNWKISKKPSDFYFLQTVEQHDVSLLNSQLNVNILERSVNDSFIYDSLTNQRRAFFRIFRI